MRSEGEFRRLGTRLTRISKTAILTGTWVLCATGPASATVADKVADVLSANHQASGTWPSDQTLQLEYAYSGQGLTGTTRSTEDLHTGAFVDSWTTGPASGATGFDGSHAWEQEPSGTVTLQAGGDVVPLAINESYRNRNSWWSGDRGGAAISYRTANSGTGTPYDVLTVIPPGGKVFEAWFDGHTHLLVKTVETQSLQTITTSYSDYSAVRGALLPHKIVIDDGSGPENLQTLSLTSARFTGPLPRSHYTAHPVELHDFSLAAGVHETTIPFQLINNHIYADVAINGGKPRLFIFDTGGHDIVTPEAAAQMGLKAQGSMTSGGGGESTVQSGYSHVDSITVGQATLTNQTVNVLQFNSPGVEGVHEGGMIGYEFFSRFITRIDYGKHTLTFIDKRHFNPRSAGTPVPMRLFHQFPEVLGSYDGIPGRFGIDTGSRAGLMLTRTFVDQYGLRAKAGKGVEAVVGWGVGGPSHGFVERGGELKLAGVTIANPLTVLQLDRHGAGAAAAFPNNVGGGVLKRFVVTFDYDHYVMYLQRLASPVADLDTYDRAGMWINDSPQGFTVVNVDPHSPAEQTGLRKGDVITAVDSRPAADIKLYELRERLRNDPPGTRITLALKRGDATQTLQITLTDLIGR